MNIYEYMQSLSVDGFTSGIDAVTVTGYGLSPRLYVEEVISNHAELLSLEEKKPFRFKGAYGWTRGSWRYAASYDNFKRLQWFILMITGKHSESAFCQLVSCETLKFTRVDVYVDVTLSQSVPDLTRLLYDAGKGKNLKLVESLTGGTLYSGSRQSESYLRIYDKSGEYSQGVGRVWRFEVEYKGGLAPLVAKTLSKGWVVSLADKDLCVDLVMSECRHRGIPTPKDGNWLRLSGRQVTLSSAEMKLNWLRKSVRGSVQYLLDLGMRDEVMEALQLGLPTGD